MSLSDIIGVIGIIVSAAFGIWGVSIALRRRKYPGEISFIKDRTIRLFDDIVRNISPLAINYKGASIANNIVLFRGHLINSGSKDISKEMVDAPLSENLRPGFKWLEANIVSCSDKLRASVHIESQEKLNFDFNLFRCGEYITFEALSELPVILDDNEQKDGGIKELSEVISWDHRITDTSKIKKYNLPAQIPKTKLSKAATILRYIGTLFVIVGLIIFFSESKLNLQYKILNGNNSIFVKIFPKDKEHLNLKGVDNAYESTITIEDFLKLNPILFIYEEYPIIQIILFFLAVIVSILLVTLDMDTIRDSYTRRKFDKILNLEISLLQKESKKAYSRDAKSSSAD